MLIKKIRKDALIRGQQEEIEAQNLLIEWLLQRVEQRQGEKDAVSSETLSEVCHGYD